MLNAVLVGCRARKPFRLAVSAVATQFALPVTLSRSHLYIVKAMCPGSRIYLGTDNTVSSSTGYPMDDGETLTMEPVQLTALWHIGGASDAISVFPFDRV